MEKNKIKSAKTEFSVMLDFLFVIIILVFMSMVNYGIRPLYIFLTSIASGYITDLICLYIRHKKFDKKDLSAVVSGGIIALMMPASVQIGIVVITNIFAIVIGKQIFGGKNNMIFNCSAVAFVFSAICWKNSVLMYPVPNQVISLISDTPTALTGSLTNMLSWATIPSVSDIDIMLGKFTGPMGATHIIVLIACAIMLLFRKSVSPSVLLSGAVSIATFAYIFPVFGNSRLSSVFYEMISGMTIFTLIFIACDYYTAPKHKLPGVLYGIALGALTSLFRHLGAVENAIIFAVIIINPFKDSFDKLAIDLKKAFYKASKNKINIKQNIEKGTQISDS